MLPSLRYKRIVMQKKKVNILLLLKTAKAGVFFKKPNIIILSCNILWKMSDQLPLLN